MVRVAFSNSFKKAFKKRAKNRKLKELFFLKLELFVIDPFHPQLKTHKLSGKLQELWSFSVEYDVRVIFHFVDNEHVIFENIGSHDEVY